MFRNIISNKKAELIAFLQTLIGKHVVYCSVNEQKQFYFIVGILSSIDIEDDVLTIVFEGTYIFKRYDWSYLIVEKNKELLINMSEEFYIDEFSKSIFEKFINDQNKLKSVFQQDVLKQFSLL